MVVRATPSTHGRLPKPFGVPCRSPLLVGLYSHETAPLSPPWPRTHCLTVEHSIATLCLDFAQGSSGPACEVIGRNCHPCCCLGRCGWHMQLAHFISQNV